MGPRGSQDLRSPSPIMAPDQAKIQIDKAFKGRNLHERERLARALRGGLATRLLVFAAIFDLCQERLLMLSFEFYQNERSLGKVIVM